MSPAQQGAALLQAEFTKTAFLIHGKTRIGWVGDPTEDECLAFLKGKFKNSEHIYLDRLESFRKCSVMDLPADIEFEMGINRVFRSKGKWYFQMRRNIECWGPFTSKGHCIKCYRAVMEG